MGLTIYKDAIYEKTIDGTAPEGYSWEPWPVIRGEAGEDVYHTWLKEQGLVDTTEWEHWDEFLATIQAYGGITGASRIIQSGDEYIAYTPNQVGSSTEPPERGATFNGYSTFSMPVVGVTQHVVTDSDTISPLYSSSAVAVDGQTMTNIEVQGSVGVQDAGVVVGNRGDNNVPIYTSHYPQYTFKHLFSTAFSANTDIVPTQRTDNAKIKDIYGSATPISAIRLEQSGNVYLGGQAQNGNNSLGCNLGNTYLVTGASTWTKKEYDMQNGTVKDIPRNGIFVKKKMGVNKSWAGAWDTRMLLDSGHFETVRLDFSKLNWVAGKTYTWNYSFANDYTEKPSIIWSIHNWRSKNGFKYFHDYFIIEWLQETTDAASIGKRAQLIIYCKKKPVVGTDIYFANFYLTAMFIRTDNEGDWFHELPAAIPNSIQ